MQIVDYRGGGQTSLQLQIEAPRPLSLTGAASMQEVLHSEPLTGNAVSLHLHTTLLFSHMHRSKSTGSSVEGQLEPTRRAVTCSVSPSAAVRSITVQHSTDQQLRCTFTLASALPKALSEVVLHGDVTGEPHLSVSVPVKVWQIENVAVTQLDQPKAVLKRISGSTSCSHISDMCVATGVLHGALLILIRIVPLMSLPSSSIHL